MVTRHPHHELADNAQYWLGEVYYDQKDYARALTEFRATVTAYPRGNKVADALLKVGFAYQALGEGAKARAFFDRGNLPRREQMIRNTLKREGLWVR